MLGGYVFVEDGKTMPSQESLAKGVGGAEGVRFAAMLLLWLVHKRENLSTL